MNRDEAKAIFSRKLKDLCPLDRSCNTFDFHTVASNLSSSKMLPYPYMVYLTLVEILEYPCVWRRMEKTLWTIPVLYRHVPFLIEHGKFGLRVSSNDPKIANKIVIDLLCGLESCFKITDRVFAEVVERKINSGDITIPNSFNHLSDRYKFHREKAIESFNSEPPPPIITQWDKDGKPIGWTREVLKPEREGYHYAAAGIDAYFSRIEYILIAAYAFLIYSPGKDDLNDFIRNNWSEKYLTIFDFAKDSRANEIYDILVDIKRTYRNKLAHGGLDHDGGSLLVHFSKIGAIPAKLSKGIKSTILPISQLEFADVCKEFDECDEFFANGLLSPIWTYLNCGFNVAFDKRSIERYKKYLSMNNEQLEDALESYSYFLDAQQNMEW